MKVCINHEIRPVGIYFESIRQVCLQEAITVVLKSFSQIAGSEKKEAVLFNPKYSAATLLGTAELVVETGDSAVQSTD